MACSHDAVGGHPWLGRSCDSLLGRWTFLIWGHRGRKVTTFNPCHPPDISHKSPPRLSLKFHIFISHQNKTLSCSSCFVKLQPDAVVPVKQLDTEPEQNWVRKQNKTNQKTNKQQNSPTQTETQKCFSRVSRPPTSKDSLNPESALNSFPAVTPNWLLCLLIWQHNPVFFPSSPWGVKPFLQSPFYFPHIIKDGGIFFF